MQITTSLNNESFPYSIFNETESPFEHVQNTSNYPTNNSNATQESSVAKYYPIIAAEMAASCLCLIFSIVVYSILPEFRNVHGKNLISMSSCMLSTYLLLILDLIIRKFISFQVCFTIAMLIHITFLATFFWTNVMAFDIWKTLTVMKAKGEVKSNSKKYMKYAIYAWTATVVASLPAAIFEATDLVHVDYKPQFGVKRCWLSNITAFIFYFNLPVGIILVCNSIMFLLIIRKLRIIKKMTAILNIKQEQERFHLYLKLFLVMGITWATEFIPWVTGVHFLYAIAGMMTALHGCFLFLIFVCKKRILRAFYQRIRQGREELILNLHPHQQHPAHSLLRPEPKKAVHSELGRFQVLVHESLLCEGFDYLCSSRNLLFIL